MTTPWQRFPRRVALAGVAVATLGPAACSGAEPAGEPTSNPPPIVVERPAGGAPTAPTDPTDPAEPAAPTATDTPTVVDVDPAAPPPFRFPGEPDVSEPSGEPLLPVALHVGDHDGYDRVVIEFAGDGVPGWRSEYVTEAVAAGRGDRIEIDADAVLAVDITGTRYPEEGEGHYAPLGPLDGKDVIEEVHYVGTFEGVTQLFVGVDDGATAYRVFPLVRPARLVIDIADPDD